MGCFKYLITRGVGVGLCFCAHVKGMRKGKLHVVTNVSRRFHSGKLLMVFMLHIRFFVAKTYIISVSIIGVLIASNRALSLSTRMDVRMLCLVLKKIR